MHIAIATADADLEHCFPVVQVLRPHLTEVSLFIEQVRRQQQEGYCLAYLETENQIRAIAGFRLAECLAWGKFLYVDDLVTAEADRSQGYGEALFRWLTDYARQHHCQTLQLDSGVQRFAAHRFYFRQRMTITSYHFGLPLEPAV